MTDGGDEAMAPDKASTRSDNAPARDARAQHASNKRFPKAARLKETDRFNDVIRKGGFAADDTLVVHVLPNGLPITRFGITIPRRTGNAVVRNRWKRLIRESIRHGRQDLPGGFDVVIRPKRGAEPRHLAIARGLPKTIRRALRRVSS